MAPESVFCSSVYWLSHWFENEVHFLKKVSMGKYHLLSFVLKTLEQNPVSVASHLVTVDDNYFLCKVKKNVTFIKNKQIFKSK